MSKTNMLIVKKSPTISNINKQTKNLIQNHVTYREGLKEDDSEKLYTFCSSEQKQVNQTEDESGELAKDRKASFNNNSKSRVYRPLSKSKGKTSSQINITKDRKKQANNSTISVNSILALNNSSIIEKKKGDKLIAKEAKKQEKMINISINLNRNYLNQSQDKQNKKQTYNNQSNSNIKSINKQKTIVMSEQELSRFTKKQAVQKMQLQKIINKLQQQLKEMNQKQIQWNNFKKDSEEYIKYLLKQKQQIISQYQSLEQSVAMLQNDKEYNLIAKQQYQNTIGEQQACIQQLKREVDESKRLRHQVQMLQNRVRQLQNANHQMSSSQILQIQNNHLKKELEIQQKYQTAKDSYIFENEKLRKEVQSLASAKETLLAQLKQMYGFKLKCELFEKSLQESNNKIAKLEQQNQHLKNMTQRQSSLQNKSEGRSQFQFRLDSSPHSLSQVEVVWRRQQCRKNMKQSNFQQYFDHDYFTGFSKQKL